MDLNVKQVRNVFGSMPIENLSAAQLMQQKSTRNKQIIIGMAGCLITGVILGTYIASIYFKSDHMRPKNIAAANGLKL